MRFIHAADIHLGTPIRGLRDVDPEWVVALQEAVVQAWERVVSAALTRAVDFVILAGDMFDSSRPSYGDYLRFFEGLERLDQAGIPVYLVTGNHDPYTTWERDVGRLPPSATLLGVNGPEFTLFSRDDEPLCLIGGRSYYNQAWPEGGFISDGITRAAAVRALQRLGFRAQDAPFALGVVHASLVPDQSKARAELPELLAADIDYWACGHLHERCAFPEGESPRVVFPGCVQGRGLSETGERGCYFVELEEGPGKGLPLNPAGGSARSSRARLEFIPTSSIVFQRIRVDVSACQTLADVRRHVQAELFHENAQVHCDEMIVQVVLTGETSLREYLVQKNTMEDLRRQLNNAYPSFFCDALVNGTGFAADTLAAGDDYFPKIVASLASEQRSRESALINFIQSEFVKRGIPVPGSLGDHMADYIDAAERVVSDLLRGEAR